MLTQKAFWTGAITRVLEKSGIYNELSSLLTTLPIPPPQGWERRKLKEIAFYPKERIDTSLLTPQNYVGVDNLLQNKQGKKDADFILKENKTTNAYKQNDILIGNIRPYLKKIWFANINGGTNGDVVVVRLKDTEYFNPKFLYYILSDDRFFQYEMDNSKGIKMPRGDKNAILNYHFSSPPLQAQQQIVKTIEKLEKRCLILEDFAKELETKKNEFISRALV